MKRDDDEGAGVAGVRDAGGAGARSGANESRHRRSRGRRPFHRPRIRRKRHDVTFIERNPDHIDVDAIPAAHWRLGDACELTLLESVKLEEFDVVVAATGDDKANVVVSLLAKTEFAVPRVVARVNDPRNEWLFDENWGVDVAVSTPRMLASLVEEAVAVGDLVRLMEFRKGQANLVEITLPDDTPWGGKPVSGCTYRGMPRW